MPSIYVWLETCSSMPHFLGLQHWTLEVAVGFSCAPQSSGFQERCARYVKARNSSRPASSSAPQEYKEGAKLVEVVSFRINIIKYRWIECSINI